MEPITAGIGAVAGIAGGFLKAFAPQPGGPAISGAHGGGQMSSPFNVGGGIGGAAQLGALAQFAPFIIIGVVAWLLLKK